MKQKFRGSILPRFQLPISLCSLYILVFPSAEDFLMGSPFLLFLGFFPESVPLYLIPWPSTIPRCMAKLVNQVHPDWMPTLHTRGHQIGLFPEHKRTSDQELLCNCFLSSLPAPGTCSFTLFFSAVFAQYSVIMWSRTLPWLSKLATVNGEWEGNSNPLRSRGWCEGQRWYFSFGESGPQLCDLGRIKRYGELYKCHEVRNSAAQHSWTIVGPSYHGSHEN